MSTTPIPIRRDVPPLTSQMAGILNVTAFITAENLSLTDILFLSTGDVLVDLHGLSHPRGDLRRWQIALDASTYTETPFVGEGCLHTDLVVTGITPTGAFVKVIARELVQVAR